MNVKLPPLVNSPSTATSDSIELDSRVGITKWSTQLLQFVTSATVDPKFTECAKDALKTLERMTKQQDTSGVLWKESNLRTSGEVAVSSVIAEAFCRAECCSRLNTGRLRWYHQFNTNYGTPDIVVAWDDGTRIQPVAVFEFGFGGTEKRPQALSYASNFTWSVKNLLEQHVDVPILVVTWAISNRNTFHEGECVLRVVGASPYTAASGKVSAIDVWAGDVNEDNVALLLHTIVQTANQIAAEAEASTREVWRNYGRNVAIRRLGDKTTDVLKLYDYRKSLRADEEVPKDQRRNSELTKRKLRADAIIDLPDLVLLKYPYIEGTHYATDVRQFIAAIENLSSLHGEDIIHGDIRAFNMVFSEGSCTFIDYDFAGHSKYPVNYVSEGLPDVERHTNAVAGRELAKEHDWFALASVMRMHAHTDKESWSAVCQQVESSVGSADAIGAIGMLEERTLKPAVELKTNDEHDLATGSPPRLKSKLQSSGSSSKRARKRHKRTNPSS